MTENKKQHRFGREIEILRKGRVSNPRTNTYPLVSTKSPTDASSSASVVLSISRGHWAVPGRVREGLTGHQMRFFARFFTFSAKIASTYQYLRSSFSTPPIANAHTNARPSHISFGVGFV